MSTGELGAEGLALGALDWLLASARWSGDGLGFATVLVADLAERATVDAAGARWSNHEHRVASPELEPRPGWAMGNAGILRELLRYARIVDGRDPSYAVPWPDHPPTG